MDRAGIIRRQFAVLTLAAVLMTADALAQRGTPQPTSRNVPPAAAEISRAARSAALDPANAGSATMFGKSFKFTPVRREEGKDATLPSEGFLGVLENGFPGDETNLPVGRHNLFLTRIGNEWRIYAESGGQVRQAIRATFSPGGSKVGGKPTFAEKGWCVQGWWYLNIFTWGPWMACF